MPESLESRIAEVLRVHAQRDEWGIPVDECYCGWPKTRADYLIDHAAHVASVIAALFKQQSKYSQSHEAMMTRLVTDWEKL